MVVKTKIEAQAGLKLRTRGKVQEKVDVNAKLKNLSNAVSRLACPTKMFVFSIKNMPLVFLTGNL